MLRYSFIFGGIIGVVVIALMVVSMTVLGGEIGMSEAAGYAIMLVVLSLIFIGIKRYRDVEQGGVVKFTQAAGVGIGIAAVAGVIYALSWEVFLFASDYAFIETYADSMIEAIRAQGLAASEEATRITEIEQIDLTVTAGNERAHILYERCGFVLVGVPLLSRFFFKRESAATGWAQTAQIEAEQGRNWLTRVIERIRPAPVPAERIDSWPKALAWLAVTLGRNLAFIVVVTVPLMLFAGLIGAVLITLLPFHEILRLLPMPEEGAALLAMMVVVALIAIVLPVPIAFDQVSPASSLTRSCAPRWLSYA